jgi:RND superfamily putative drug exporter
MSRWSTQRLARLCSRRPWTVVSIWVGLVAVSLFLSATLLFDSVTTESGFRNAPDSKRADDLIAERADGPQGVPEVVVLRSADIPVVEAPRHEVILVTPFRGQIQNLFADIIALGDEVVAGGTHFFQSGDETLVSPSGFATVIPLLMAGDQETAQDNIDQVLEIVDAADTVPTGYELCERGCEGFEINIVGEASIGKDFETISQEDLRTGESIGLAAALLILILVFGVLVASLVPIAMALASIIIAFGISALLGQAVELSFFLINFVGLIGLAVGIDYSLFIVSRYREERARGADKLEAIEASALTASRAVLFSGMTVVIALLGLLIVPTVIFQSLAIGAIVVVGVSVLAALTLLPAILSLLGDRIDSLRIPLFGRARARAAPERGGGGFWGAIAAAVMRRPLLSLIAAAALLIALAIPTLDLKTGDSGISTLPDSTQTADGFSILKEEFAGGLASPTEIVVDGDAQSPAVISAVEELQQTLPEQFGPATVETNSGGNLTVVSAPVLGDVVEEPAFDAVRELRDEVIPAAFAGSGAEVFVTGQTAVSLDFRELTNTYWPIVIGFVLALSFILLTVAFRSIVIPLTSIVVNLLAVGAAYGLLVLVFQKGWATDLLGFQQTDTIEPFIPLVLFTVLFGLSMDYQVFLLSRIRERYDETGDNADAVWFGVASTGRIITGAALIMVAVFAGFATGRLVPLQQMGFGLAVAILIDATIVRAVLVPAAMRLLGERNWYLPGFLAWLPTITIDDRGRDRAA